MSEIISNGSKNQNKRTNKQIECKNGKKLLTTIDCVKCINTVAADCLELIPQNHIGVKNQWVIICRVRKKDTTLGILPPPPSVFIFIHAVYHHSWCNQFSHNNGSTSIYIDVLSISMSLYVIKLLKLRKGDN